MVNFQNVSFMRKFEVYVLDFIVSFLEKQIKDNKLYRLGIEEFIY